VSGSFGVGKIDDRTSLSSILRGAAWTQIASETESGKVPEGCSQCVQREQETGHAGRKDYDDPDWDKGLTFLEINTSNICTLQCRHCDGHFSHRWAKLQGMPTHKADSKLLIANLSALDLSALKRVAFKGGEPLLNPDLLAVLRHLDAIGRLSEVTVQITTNGSVAPTEPIALLKKARVCEIGISVDGSGDRQTYIRHGRSGTENIRELVRLYSAIRRARFGLIVSIMAYNVFDLPNIAKWWREIAGHDLHSKWQRRWRHWTGRPCFHPLGFWHFVTSPEHLSVTSLQDKTRESLAANYERLDPILYSNVIKMLRQPFAGTRVHDRLVVETLRNDRLMGRSYRQDIPELIDEFVLLEADSALLDVHALRARNEITEEDHRWLLSQLAALNAG
jgi:Radical SAM superfamily/4Fe-4S single cluster domain